MARMVCVLFMIYVHVPDGQSNTIVYTLTSGGFSTLLEGLLVEGPGRASAALLSVISGYLAATALLKPGSSVWSLYRRRFTSIILPMVFWASVTYLIYLLVSQTRLTFLNDAHTLLDKLNIVFFLTGMPVGATMHLGFLRDLFVCILLSPLLLPALQRMAWLLLPLLGVFYLLEHNQSSIVILRPLVLFAFSIGVYFAIRQVRLDALDRFWPVFLVLSIVATLVILLFNSGAGANVVEAFAAQGLQFDETVLYPIGRLLGSLAIWTLLPLCLGGHLRTWTIRFTPYLFAAFCSHYLMLTLMFYGGWNPLFGGRESSLYVLWFLAAPVMSMAVAVLVVQIALKLFPPLAMLITGGRMSGAGKQPDPQQERRRQGVVLAFWLALLRASESLGGRFGTAAREWLEVSRRLLLGRR